MLAIVAVAWLQPTAVSGQTPEGAVITNVANVSYDDANGNNYASGPASVNVTVGHFASISVVAAQGTATPASPSGPNTIVFTVNNIGNGVDTVSVARVNTDPSVLVVTNFFLNAAPYADIAALNVALADTTILAGGAAVITVEYSVPINKGGEPSTYTLTGTSQRDGSAFDSDSTLVTPALTGTVATTPKGSQSLTHLPSNGGNYTFQFTVTNNQTGADDFNLLATSPGSSVITILTVDGVVGASTTITLAAGAFKNIDVEYLVVVSGLNTDTLYLAATSVADSDTNDQGFADMTVIEADLSITKVAYRNDMLTPIGAGLVLLGEYIQYKVTVTNVGPVTASNVVVADNLPGTLTYDSRTNDVGTWTVGGSGNTRTFTLTTDLDPTFSASFFIRALVN